MLAVGVVSGVACCLLFLFVGTQQITGDEEKKQKI